MAPHRFFACFLVLAACADDNDPPPAESDVTTAVMAPTTTNDAPTAVCEAGETRECKIFYTSADEPGVQHCLVGTQVCRPDGLAWKACGAQ